jgi:hypothetical protein
MEGKKEGIMQSLLSIIRRKLTACLAISRRFSAVISDFFSASLRTGSDDLFSERPRRSRKREMGLPPLPDRVSPRE